MPKTLIPLNNVTLPFIEMGFNSKRAFVNVVNQIDLTITDWDLEFAWDFGICSKEVRYKIDHIIETLKNE